MTNFRALPNYTLRQSLGFVVRLDTVFVTESETWSICPFPSSSRLPNLSSNDHDQRVAQINFNSALSFIPTSSHNASPQFKIAPTYAYRVYRACVCAEWTSVLSKRSYLFSRAPNCPFVVGCGSESLFPFAHTCFGSLFVISSSLQSWSLLFANLRTFLFKIIKSVPLCTRIKTRCLVPLSLSVCYYFPVLRRAELTVLFRLNYFLHAFVWVAYISPPLSWLQ